MSPADRISLLEELYAPVLAKTCHCCGHTTHQRVPGAGVISKETYLRLLFKLDPDEHLNPDD